MVEATLRTVLIGSVIGFMILAGCFVMIGQFVNSGVDTQNFNQYNHTFNQLAGIANQSNKMASQTETLKKPKPGLFGIIDGLIDATFSTLNIMWDVVKIMGNLLISLPILFPFIPAWATGAISSILIILIAMIFIGLWMMKVYSYYK